MLPLEGEVWEISLDPTIGHELQKTRPCVVVNTRGIQNFGLRVAVPLTGWKPESMSRRPWFVEISPDPGNGLSKPSAAAVHHIRSVATERFTRRLGRLSADDMDTIRASLKIVLGIP